MNSRNTVRDSAVTLVDSESGSRPSWKFVCPLAFVLVDRKQVAKGDVLLVVKRDVPQSFALSSYDVDLERVASHRLLVFAGNETEPFVDLTLDDFLSLTPGHMDPLPARYSLKSCRLYIRGTSASTSTPLHDLRFTKSDDLQEVIARLSEIGVSCHSDDDIHVQRPFSSNDLRHQIMSPGFLPGTSSESLHAQTLSPTYVLSTDMVKSRRIKSPLERRADGSTPPFAIRRVRKKGPPAPTLPLQSQSSTGPGRFVSSNESHMTSVFCNDAPDQMPSSQTALPPRSSQASQLMPPPRRFADLFPPNTRVMVKPELPEPQPIHQLELLSIPVNGESTSSPPRRRRPLQEISQIPRERPQSMMSGELNMKTMSVPVPSRPGKRGLSRDTASSVWSRSPAKRNCSQPSSTDELTKGRDSHPETSDRPAERPRSRRRQHRPRETTASQYAPPPHLLEVPEKGAIQSLADGLSQTTQIQEPPQPRPVYVDSSVQTDHDEELDARIAEMNRRQHQDRVKIWETLWPKFCEQVDVAPADDPRLIMQIVEDYQRDLAEAFRQSRELQLTVARAFLQR